MMKKTCLMKICRNNRYFPYSNKNKEELIKFIISCQSCQNSTIPNKQEGQHRVKEIFNKNVKGKIMDVSNKKHDGEGGHYLEKLMGILHNSHNEPDLHGVEIKKDCKTITLGDFVASEYIFSPSRKYLEQDLQKISLLEFFRCFGFKNTLKNGRYSWSGKCCPAYVGEPSFNGQTLKILSNKDIVITYHFADDKRCDKDSLVYPWMKTPNGITIVIWKSDKMKNHIEKKFGVNGTMICKRNKSNEFSGVELYEPFYYDDFLNGLNCKEIKFDSGMYSGNNRRYSHWRTCKNNKFWENFQI